jgi:hypothetical protein
VSDRGLPVADGAHACPFVAFEDERDERASLPDHRHRCYAENPPAPRALAHQEAYCLSSAFPVCPTFQDWARRESARARGEAAARPVPPPSEPLPPEAIVAAPAALAAAAADSGHAPEDAPVEDPASVDPAPVDPAPVDPAPVDPPPQPDDDAASRRNPPRDWSAPPPWLASSEVAGSGYPSEPPSFLASRSEPGQGLAGSAADQLAGGPPPPTRTSSAAAVAGAAAASAAAAASVPRPDPSIPESDDLPQPAAPPRRPRAYDQHLGGPSSGPDWERPKRYEAYPTIKTRVGLPEIPRIAVMVVALAIAALAVFFLPAILGLGSPNSASSSPTPSPSASRSIEPTPSPVPTQVVYVIKKGDTLLKIASANGLTLPELMTANPTIKDPNKISEGQQIIIPPPAAPGGIGGSAAPSGSPAP